MDRPLKTCKNWNSIHNDIENIKSNLIKNSYPPSLINKTIENTSIISFLVTENQLKDISDVYYFKLP